MSDDETIEREDTLILDPAPSTPKEQIRNESDIEREDTVLLDVPQTPKLRKRRPRRKITYDENRPPNPKKI